MALSSQTGRKSSRTSFMSSRRRSRRGRLVLAVLAVVVIGGGSIWYFVASANTADPSAVPTVATNDAAPQNPPRILDVASARESGTVELTREAIIAPTPEAEKPLRVAPKPAEVTSNPTPIETQSEPASHTLAAALKLADTDPVEARRVVTKAWRSGDLSPEDRTHAAALANRLSDIVLFDQRIFEGDPFSKRYTVGSGDALERIARKEGVETEWAFIARVNNLKNPNAIRIGQTLKLPVGTFHAEIFKPEYRLDLYQDANGERVFVGSYAVGLGEFGSTPVGLFRVRPASKLINPEWLDQRTRTHFTGGDPDNPIGKRWIGIQGLEDRNRALRGFGIHGTIDPDSIGRQKSMGCIRMLPEDVSLVFDLLTEPNSTIEIHGPKRIVTQPDTP